MSRNVKILMLSGLTVTIITGVGYLAAKRMREQSENTDLESEET